MCLSHTGLLFGSLSSWMAANLVWWKDFAEDVGSALLGRHGAFWIRGMLWVCARQPAYGMSRRSMGPEKELFALTMAVEFRPCAAETLKACALIGLHMITEEAASLSLSGIFAELGDRWRHGDPRNSLWKGDDGGWTESERTSSCEVYEHDVESLALEVLGKTGQAK